MINLFAFLDNSGHYYFYFRRRIGLWFNTIILRVHSRYSCWNSLNAVDSNTNTTKLTIYVFVGS
jgi:hypothetical protein